MIEDLTGEKKSEENMSKEKLRVKNNKQTKRERKKSVVEVYVAWEH